MHQMNLKKYFKIVLLRETVRWLQSTEDLRMAVFLYTEWSTALHCNSTPPTPPAISFNTKSSTAKLLQSLIYMLVIKLSCL